jgi:hypothetical protein
VSPTDQLLEHHAAVPPPPAPDPGLRVGGANARTEAGGV